MIFNPESTRRYLTEGGVELVVNARFEPSRPMGNVAQRLLDDVIRAWLTGLSDEVAPALPKILEWLELAISSQESFGPSPSLHQMKLTWAKSLASWMLTASSSEASWEQVRRRSVDALADPSSFDEADIATERLDDYMAFCFQSNTCPEGVSEFERFQSAPQEVRLSVRSLNPREIGFLLCREKLDGKDVSDSLEKAAVQMLTAHLQSDWLGRGQMLRAATWLKIVYWHRSSSLSPLATLLRAYDNMPKVRRPDFLS